jgi:hypothetical protein
MRFEYVPSPMRSQWHWLGYNIIFWLVLGLGTWMVSYGSGKGDYAFVNLGYITIGAMVVMMIWTIIETVLYKQGKLKDHYLHLLGYEFQLA